MAPPQKSYPSPDRSPAQISGATKIGVLYLDHDLSIRKFTNAMTDIVPFTQADIGRSVEFFSYEFMKSMVTSCKEVLQQHKDEEVRQAKLSCSAQRRARLLSL